MKNYRDFILIALGLFLAASLLVVILIHTAFGQDCQDYQWDVYPDWSTIWQVEPCRPPMPYEGSHVCWWTHQIWKAKTVQDLRDLENRAWSWECDPKWSAKSDITLAYHALNIRAGHGEGVYHKLSDLEVIRQAGEARGDPDMGLRAAIIEFGYKNDHWWGYKWWLRQ